MTIPVHLEAYIALSIYDTLKTNAAIVSDGVFVQSPGGSDAAGQDREDWIEQHLLSIPQANNRRDLFLSNNIQFQVSCFSKTANVRTDNDTQRPAKLAGIARAALKDQKVAIRPHGNQALLASTPIIACFMPRLDGAAYIPEAVHPGANGVPSTPSNLHMWALTFGGTIVVV